MRCSTQVGDATHCTKKNGIHGLSRWRKTTRATVEQSKNSATSSQAFVCPGRHLAVLASKTGGAVQDRFARSDEETRYRELYLAHEESDWVKHYLRIADHALFGKRTPPRAVVVDDKWSAPRDEKISLKKPA